VSARRWRSVAAVALGALLLLAALCIVARFAFAPRLSGSAAVASLRAEVAVDFDALGVPAVRARSRDDALTALGYATAQERLFQMDLMRRQSGGRLAEVFGKTALAFDREQRHYGMAGVADAVAARLPEDQRRALAAYAAGVNAFLEQTRVLPLEFVVLGYRPERWRPRDSILVVLGMFEVLSNSEALERSRTIVRRHAPADLSEFLLSGSDPYTEALLAQQGSWRARPALPETVARARATRSVLSARAGEAPVGSNGWAVAGSRTRDGRALLANDMHLELGLPNVWYRAELHYGDVALRGLSLPGVPLIVAGSNGHVAWGLTNLEGDVLDLVELELDPARPGMYVGPDGLTAFGTRREAIVVRDAATEQLTVRTTVWGPVSERPLLGKPVAIRWSALDPGAIDLGLLALADARDLRAAAAVLNRAGMPPLNALIANASGEVGWTVTGRIPRRRGFSGAESAAWGGAKLGWEGYLSPEQLPRLLQPRQGFVINANQRMPSAPDAPTLGQDFGHGYRAYRIAERLAARPGATEADMLALQLDTRSEPFEAYREVALRVLEAGPTWPERDHVRAALEAWDGRAELDSRGFALLRLFRRRLVDAVFAGWLASCSAAEPDFALDFADVDTPLTRALRADQPGLFAFATGGRDTLVLSALRDAARTLAAEHPDRSISTLRWGDVSRAQVGHPLSVLPLAGWLLDMPEVPLAGCGFCVRMNADGLGASERMVVSPAHEADGILHMPGGQSGSPFSAHYRDQQRAWVEGRALAFSAGAASSTLRLRPARTRANERKP
jgi:penicillin G amidase